jgi:hypothetical protein
VRFLIYFVFVLPAGCLGQSTSTTLQTGENQLTETTVDGIVLQPRTVVEGKLSLLMPKSFTVMDEEMLQTKYPNERRPTLVYTDESSRINVAINHTANRISMAEIEDVHKYMDSTIRNTHPSATWFASDVIPVNGRQWFRLDVRTPAIDTEIRNVMMGTSVEGRMLLVSFNVTRELEEEWIEVARTIVQSLQVND